MAGAVDVHSTSMTLLRPFALRVICCCLLGLPGFGVLRAGENPPPPAPVPAPDWDRFEFAFESGVMFGLNNPNNYITTPEIISLRWQRKAPEQFFHTPFTFSQQWVVSAVIVPFEHGPEHHYFGLGLGPRIVLAKPGSRFSVYIDGRFVVGDIDSTGEPYGQGQDLTFSALVGTGVRYEVNCRTRVSLGFLYEHFSNGGLSEPEVDNTGLDTIGPKFEVSYSF